MASPNEAPVSAIHVQVIPAPDRAGQLAPSKSWEALQNRIDELGRSIGEIATRFRGQLDESLAKDESQAWHLDEVKVTFSLDLEAEAGVVVARAKTSAGFEVELGWTRS